MRRLIGTAVLSLLAAAPLAAHHYFRSSFDSSRPLLLKGTISRIEWTNPHSRFFLDVKDSSGKITTWNCESGSPGTLSREGLTRNDMKAGDVVTFDVFPALNGAAAGIIRRFILPNGHVILTSFADDGEVRAGQEKSPAPPRASK